MNNKVIGFVYLITNTVNQKHYVGQTRYSIHRRFRGHCKKNYTLIDRAIRKYGEDRFVVEELDIAHAQEELDNLEKQWIISLNCRNLHRGYNLKEGGNGGSLPESTKKLIKIKATGRKVSEETKERMSLAHSIRPRKSLSKETRTKLSKIAAKRTKETKEKIAKRRKEAGYIVSEETRAKISESLLKHHTNKSGELIQLDASVALSRS